MAQIGTYLTAAALLLATGLRAQADLCTGAILLGCGSTVSGNTSGFGADVAPFCGTTDGTGGGVWYRFVGTGTNTTASLCGSAYDTKVRVYTGSCGALTCTVGNDDFCGLQSQVTWNATAGVTYYILVHGFGSSSGAYTLTLTCAPPPVPMCYSTNVTGYLADPYAGTAVTLSDDWHSGIVNIGFSFCYNGTTYSRCVISSNNYITFDLTRANTYSSWQTVAVPTLAPAEVRTAILNPWQDIHPGVGGTITYQTLGVAPNRRFVVSYLNVPMFSCTSQLYTSQTVLYEGSNCIASYIASKPICTTWNSGHAVHALHNAAGTSATVVAGRNNTQWTANNAGLLFVPTCSPCQTASSLQCLSVVLPVDLLHFSGHNEGSRNVLEWATASEENSLDFMVERSSDAEAFAPIAVVPAAGNSLQTLRYSVVDEAPAPGVNYYRLRSTDQDGSVRFSEVVPVMTRAIGRPLLHPLPAHGSVTVTVPEGLVLPAPLELHDLTGRVLRRWSVTVPTSFVDLEGLPAGTYFLRIAVPGAGTGATLVVE